MVLRLYAVIGIVMLCGWVPAHGQALPEPLPEQPTPATTTPPTTAQPASPSQSQPPASQSGQAQIGMSYLYGPPEVLSGFNVVCSENVYNDATTGSPAAELHYQRQRCRRAGPVFTC